MTVPETLADALLCLANLIPVEQQIELIDKDEDEFGSESHFSLGAALRNQWGLRSGKTELSKWFQRVGIEEPDDMSAIILTSFHRKICGKPIDLKNQIVAAVGYW